MTYPIPNRLRLLAAAGLTSILLGACMTPAAFSHTDEAARDASSAEKVSTSQGDVLVEELASLNFPWGMEYLPDGRLLITEKPGTLRIFEDGTLSEPVEGVPAVAYRNQGGLLDVAVDPDFANNQYIYLYIVRAAEDQPADPVVQADPRLGPYVDEEDTTAKHGAVVRARMTPDGLEDLQTIWSQSEDVVGLGHYGGRMVFASDGTLIITSGERQTFSPAQDLSSNLGAVIRINSDGSIPDDNPHADRPAPQDAIWSYGHRNPLGMAYQPGTDVLWIHEMGPLYGDELNRIEPQTNFGWPTVSNGEHYNRVEIAHHETALMRYERPVFYWRPAISPSGMDFYTGDMFPDWTGDGFIGGLSAETLVRVRLNETGQVTQEERIAVNKRIRDVMTAEDGSIYLLTDYEDGALLRLTQAE